MRILLKAITITAIAALGLVPAGPGHAAEVEPADLMAINKHPWQENVQIGDVFRTHPVAVRNKGPYATQTGSATWEVKLPGNVEFYNESNFNRCQTIVPRKHVKCVVDGMWYPYVEPGGGMGADSVFQWDVVLVSNSTTLGRFTVEYPNDPDPANNSVSFAIVIRNQAPANPGPTPTTKAPSVASPTSAASATPGGSPSASTEPSPTPELSETPEPSVPISDSHSAESGLSMGAIARTLGLVAGGTGAISLAGYVLLFRHRKSGEEHSTAD